MSGVSSSGVSAPGVRASGVSAPGVSISCVSTARVGSPGGIARLVRAIVSAFCVAGALGTSSAAAATPPEATQGSSVVNHYEYVFVPGEMYVYDMDEDQRLVQHVTGLPDEDGVRGVMVNSAAHILYISHGSDGPAGTKGSLLAYDLVSGTVLWNRTYEFPIDSGAITPDGKTIYMPTGENDASGIWNTLNAANGEPIGQIQGGDGEAEIGAHNTIVSLDGKDVFLGARNSDYLDVASTATNQVVQKIGPLENGVRPFTVNGTDTLAFTTATEFLGFQISSIVTGKVLYTVPIPGFTVPGTFTLSAPSHGITLTPDEQQLYVMDAANSYVHVFDVSGVPADPPTLLKNIPLAPIEGEEQPCAYDCGKSGWLQASLDGRFVYVGDSGAVIDTSTREVVAILPALAESREMLEIDWADGVPVATSSRYGLGYVTSAAGSPPGEEPGPQEPAPKEPVLKEPAPPEPSPTEPAQQEPARQEEPSSPGGASPSSVSRGTGQAPSGGSPRHRECARMFRHRVNGHAAPPAPLRCGHGDKCSRETRRHDKACAPRRRTGRPRPGRRHHAGHRHDARSKLLELASDDQHGRRDRRPRRRRSDRARRTLR
jgi:DNA-binding beta-propeller fold protein YncE